MSHVQFFNHFDLLLIFLIFSLLLKSLDLLELHCHIFRRIKEMSDLFISRILAEPFNQKLYELALVTLGLFILDNLLITASNKLINSFKLILMRILSINKFIQILWPFFLCNFLKVVFAVIQDFGDGLRKRLWQG